MRIELTKRNKLRLLVYSVLTAPFFVGLTYYATRGEVERSSLATDFRRNFGKLIAGELEFGDVLGIKSEVVTVNDRRGGYYGRDPTAIFSRLDENENDRLEPVELGTRLRSRLNELDADADGGLSMSEFESGMRTRWTSATRPAAGQVGPVHHLSEPSVAAENQPPLTADGLLDENHVAHIQIALDADDWRTLCHQSRDYRSAVEDPLDKPYSYFKADIIIDGVAIQQVAIRKKGFIGSQDTVRPSLKVKFDEYVDQSPIEGLDRLTLNNNKQDGSLLSQTMTYELFRRAGVAAPRCAFALVTVNGEHLGIYSHVESVRKPYLQRVFGDDSGNLYEGTLTDFYPLAIEWLEAKTNKKRKDRPRVMGLAHVLDRPDVTVKELEEYVDVENFLSYWAVESLINFWMAIPKIRITILSTYVRLTTGCNSCRGGRQLL